MKKSFLLIPVLTICLLGSCMTSGGLSSLGGASNPSAGQTTSGASKSASLLENLLGSLVGGNGVTAKNIVGTWNFTGTDCVFETENFLMQAGGEVAATQIETKLDGILAKVGIKAGSCSYTFNGDGSYTATIGGRTMMGTYELDEENQTITMTYLAGLGKVTSKISKLGNSISLLYESDKLLKVASAVGKLTGGNAGNTLSTLMSSYDGLYVGLKLQK